MRRGSLCPLEDLRCRSPFDVLATLRKGVEKKTVDDFGLSDQPFINCNEDKIRQTKVMNTIASKMDKFPLNIRRIQ